MIASTRYFLAALLMAISVSSLEAAPLVIHPFVKGSFSEIKQQVQKPFILIFWSESCAYCMKELAMFGKLQASYPEMKLIVVATDPFLEEAYVQKVVTQSELALDETWVFAEEFPERIYADVNRRWRGELPVTHFFDREGKETRHLGIVKLDDLEHWLELQQVK